MEEGYYTEIDVQKLREQVSFSLILGGPDINEYYSSHYLTIQLSCRTR